MYPTFDAYNNSYRVNSPMRPVITNSNFGPSKPFIRDFQELEFREILQIHRIDMKNDEFSSLLLKEDEKLLSVNKYPDDIFLTGFCFWFDNNFRLNGLKKDNLVIYFNKIRKDTNTLQFGNVMAGRTCKIPFDDRFLKSLGNFWDFNIPANLFHQYFYDSLSKSNSEYMHILYSTYMRVCCFYVMQRIKDCFLLKDKLIIQECQKNFDNYSRYLEDFKSKSFYSDEYRLILNLLCEVIGITVKLITINKPQRVFLKESFPTNINKSFDLYKQILKLKFIIIIDNDNSAVYRAYRKTIEKIKYCQECKATFDTKIKSNLKNVCYDCFKTFYCSMNKERLEKDDFFESPCKHKYCKSCLIYLYNSNQTKSNLNCYIADCKKPISFAQIEAFFKNKKNTDKNNVDLDEFKCPNCQKNAIISKNPKNNYVFCCKLCNKSSCILHKALIEKCDCYCPKCKNKYNTTFQQVGDFSHIELLECLECKALVCKTCKENLKNYEDYCSCKCYLCYDLRLNEMDKGDIHGRCRGCSNLCNICFLSLKKEQINFCKKCKMIVCRVCLNEIASGEKYQYFSKKDFCIYCENSKKK